MIHKIFNGMKLINSKYMSQKGGDSKNAEGLEKHSKQLQPLVPINPENSLYYVGPRTSSIKDNIKMPF